MQLEVAETETKIRQAYKLYLQLKKIQEEETPGSSNSLRPKQQTKKLQRNQYGKRFA